MLICLDFALGFASDLGVWVSEVLNLVGGFCLVP